MNRTLRRPMFRMGGSAEGITSGLQPSQGLAFAGVAGDGNPKPDTGMSMMEKLKIQDPTLYYKMLMSEGVAPRIKLNIPVQLEFERNNPEFGSQYSDALTQNKSEGGITGLRSKYEYKK